MTYAQIYRDCQSLAPYTKRGEVYRRVLNITGLNQIKHFRATLDTKVCRGYYLHARNTDHPLVKVAGTHLIVTARSLDPNWERFVFVKELMHALDRDEAAVDTGQGFEDLLSEFESPSGKEITPAMLSEVRCFWKALALLCPEAKRQEFIERRKHGGVAGHDIASELRLPLAYVPRLFEQRYETIIGDLTR